MPVTGILSETWAIVIIVVGLLSGALAVLREFQVMYAPARATDKRVFWAWVRIAFIVAAVLLWFNEKSKVRQLLAKPPVPLQVNVPAINIPPTQVVVIQTPTGVKPHLTSFAQFKEIVPLTVNQNNVVAAGNNIGFNFYFEQKGPAPIDELGNVEMVSIVDTTEKDAEAKAQNEFAKLIKTAKENTREAGAKLHSLGIGQVGMNSANTDRVLTQADVDGILLTHKVRIYVHGWLSWKDQQGNSGQVNQCMWVQPPANGILRPDNILWDMCEERRSN